MPAKVTPCEVCGVAFNNSDMKRHVDTNKHKRNIQQLSTTNDNKLNTIVIPNTTPITNIQYNCDANSKQIIDTLNQYFGDIKQLIIPKDFIECHAHFIKNKFIASLSSIDQKNDKRTISGNMRNMANTITEIILQHQCKRGRKQDYKRKCDEPIYSYNDNFFIRLTTLKDNWIIDNNARLLISRYIVPLINHLYYFSHVHVGVEPFKWLSKIFRDDIDELKNRIINNLKTETEIAYIELLDIHHNKHLYQDNITDSKSTKNYIYTYFEYDIGTNKHNIKLDQFLNHIILFSVFMCNNNLLEQKISYHWCRMIIERDSHKWNNKVIKQDDTSMPNYVKKYDLKSSINLIKPFIKHVNIMLESVITNVDKYDTLITNECPITEIHKIVKNNNFGNYMIQQMEGMFNNDTYIRDYSYKLVKKKPTQCLIGRHNDQDSEGYPSEVYVTPYYFDERKRQQYNKTIKHNDSSDSDNDTEKETERDTNKDNKTINIHRDPIIHAFMLNIQPLHERLVELLMFPYGPPKLKLTEMYGFQKQFFSIYPQFNIKNKTSQTYHDMVVPFIDYCKEKIERFACVTEYLKLKEYTRMNRKLRMNLSDENITKNMHDYITDYFNTHSDIKSFYIYRLNKYLETEAKNNVSTHDATKTINDNDSDSDDDLDTRKHKKSGSDSDDDTNNYSKTKINVAKKSDNDSDNPKIKAKTKKVKNKSDSDSDDPKTKNKKVKKSDNDSDDPKIKANTKKKSDIDSDDPETKNKKVKKKSDNDSDDPKIKANTKKKSDIDSDDPETKVKINKVKKTSDSDSDDPKTKVKTNKVKKTSDSDSGDPKTKNVTNKVKKKSDSDSDNLNTKAKTKKVKKKSDSDSDDSKTTTRKTKKKFGESSKIPTKTTPKKKTHTKKSTKNNNSDNDSKKKNIKKSIISKKTK
jgi:hypothetical protein